MRLTTTHRAIVVVVLALITAAVLYPVLRPSRQDTCASEILINGRGGKVDVTAQTISIGAQSQPVPLEKMTSDSQVLIDQLARLCRQNAKGQISSDQYFAQVDKLLRAPEKVSTTAAKPKIPRFNGSIGVTGAVDNRAFQKFAEDNQGKIVSIRLEIDGSSYSGNPLLQYFLKKCYGADQGTDGTFPGQNKNLFGSQLSLIETKQNLNEWAEPTEQEKQIGCGPTIEFDSKDRNLNWSWLGTGILAAKIEGFFRESADQIGTNVTYRFEEIQGSVSDYAQAQQ